MPDQPLRENNGVRWRIVSSNRAGRARLRSGFASQPRAEARTTAWMCTVLRNWHRSATSSHRPLEIRPIGSASPGDLPPIEVTRGTGTVLDDAGIEQRRFSASPTTPTSAPCSATSSDRSSHLILSQASAVGAPADETIDIKLDDSQRYPQELDEGSTKAGLHRIDPPIDQPGAYVDPHVPGMVHDLQRLAADPPRS